MMAGRRLKSNAPKTALPVDVIINRVLDAIVACGAMGDLERSRSAAAAEKIGVSAPFFAQRREFKMKRLLLSITYMSRLPPIASWTAYPSASTP